MQKLLLAMLIGCFCMTPLNAFGAMTIKLGVVTKPGSAQNIVAEKFKALMEERSGGEVAVKIYHSKSIGNETEILQQIQMNTVQMGIITVGPSTPSIRSSVSSTIPSCSRTTNRPMRSSTDLWARKF